jgi:hypothetical protein
MIFGRDRCGRSYFVVGGDKFNCKARLVNAPSSDVAFWHNATGTDALNLRSVYWGVPPLGLAAPPGRAALSPQICTPTHTMQLVILTGLSARPPGVLRRDPRHHNCIILMNYAKRT